MKGLSSALHKCIQTANWDALRCAVRNEVGTRDIIAALKREKELEREQTASHPSPASESSY